MELRHLRYFVAVAEAENVSRAALKLHVSQPALSRQIRDLEQELGLSLLERSAKSVRLTKTGRVFLVESRAVLLRVAEAVSAAKAVVVGERGELHIGYAPTLTARMLPPALRAFQAAMPNVRVMLHDLSTEGMLTGLREGKLQLALLARPAKAALRELRFEAFGEDPLRLAVAPKHPFARRRSVSLTEAARESFIAYRRAEYPDYHVMLDATFAGTKGNLRIAEEHDGVSSLISAIEAGQGVALVTESLGCLAGRRLKLVPLTPDPPPLVIGVCLIKGRLPPVAQVFLRVVNETTVVANG